MSNVQAKFQQAFALHQKGQLAQAQSFYEVVLKMQPRHFDALHLSGVLASQARNYPKALELITEAVKINPHYAEAHSNLGITQEALGQLDGALASYDRAIALKPSYAEAYSNRGVILLKLGQLDAALASCDQAIALNPDFADAYYNRGNILTNLEKWDAALASYDRAIALKVAFAEAYCNRGNVLSKLKNWDAALASCNQAIALKPDYAGAYCNRGNILTALKRWNAALADCDRAIALNPTFAEAYCNRGNALLELGRLDDALISYDQAIAFKPDSAEAYSNRGNTFLKLGQLDAAIASCDKAIALNSDYAEGHLNKAFALLLAGRFQTGWVGHEWRWKEALVKKNFSEPLWLGKESLAGKTILLHAEQGLGDTLQFCRYSAMIEALGARVILQVQNPLMAILAGLRGLAQLVEEGSTLPAFDYHCPLVSLPLAFKTTLDNIPASNKYLSAPAMEVEQWQSRLGTKTNPRVGLTWRGNIQHKNDHNRSVALSDLIHYLPTGIQYVSLQKEINNTDEQVLKFHPEILHFGNELEDFTDTAALCELMDVVISVDTSVAHLSAALGRPTWIMLPHAPDWRWQLNRKDSPWYPTVRLYRQEKRGEWKNAFEDVKADLLQMV